ncbi:MAG: ATP-binding protein [FCB group bacterium]|jgi:SpoVK/Ycf46/Vps4 family AAA+-type ATPase|nr:ATP-binding protein [FCB group bacterium]
MATAEQLKALIRSHLSDDSERFYTTALQVAAYEAQQGHGALAHDIREIVDKARRERTPRLLKFPVDLRGLVFSEEPDTPRASLVAPEALSVRIERIIHEYRQQHKLKLHGLTHRRKLLLVGSPGTGKTMTARVLAHDLRLHLHTVQVDKLVTKFMGETSAKLRQIFDLIQQEQGVYLFDEFDAIGGERSLENDVAEMRRVLNSFLQFIEQDSSDSLIVAATNSPKLLDRALFRRFDDVLYYGLPEEAERQHLIQNVLGTYLAPKFAWKAVLSESAELSQADIDNACRDAIKQVILADKKYVTPTLLRAALAERHSAQRGLRG